MNLVLFHIVILLPINFVGLAVIGLKFFSPAALVVSLRFWLISEPVEPNNLVATPLWLSFSIFLVFFDTIASVLLLTLFSSFSFDGFWYLLVVSLALYGGSLLLAFYFTLSTLITISHMAYFLQYWLVNLFSFTTQYGSSEREDVAIVPA